MTIFELIEKNKKENDDIEGIVVSIEDSKTEKELYFGEVKDVPTDLHACEVMDISTICVSFDAKREGANLIKIQK